MTSQDGFVEAGKGLNVFEQQESVEGVIRWLNSPDAVMDFVDEEPDAIEQTVIVVRGGATTFLTPALTAGIQGIITLQGTPESHLGIVSREFGVPCVLSVAFERGVHTDRGEVIPADGVRVRLDVSSRPTATVWVEENAPDHGPVEDTGTGMSAEQMEQIQHLLTYFQGDTDLPHGSEGDLNMRKRLEDPSILHLDDPSVSQRSLTLQETNDLVKYLTWNEWDALAARATEGESGLIPRQEYETLGIMNSWFKHPGWLRVIDEAIGADGAVELGARVRTELGTKLNLLHTWAMATAPSFGRGMALEMELHEESHDARGIIDAMSVVRRVYQGHWGSGPMLTSMRGYTAPLLEDHWIDRFRDDRLALPDDGSRTTFQRFAGSTELAAFLLHFDNRLGLAESGPYPLPDGGFVLVRDLFLNEETFPWSDPEDDLPYAVTTAMFFRPDSGLQVRLIDIATAFTEPANYLPHVDGVAVYVRSHRDTPMSDLKVLTFEDMQDLRQRCEDASAKLYRRISAMSKREKILAGAQTYSTGFLLPFARAAGMEKILTEEHGLLDLHPTAEAAISQIETVAAEMVPRMFLTGSWGRPLLPEHVR